MASTVRVLIALFGFVAFPAVNLGGCSGGTNGAAAGASSTPNAATSGGLTQPIAAKVDISWTMPMETGSQLAGYHIYYGTSSADLTHVVNISGPGSTSFVVDNLSNGTWYFAIKSYDTANIESGLSAIVPITI